jgi:hypothetical protein
VADGPVLPLAPEQRLLLAAAARAPAAAYTTCYGYRVVGALDVDRLAAVTRRLAAEVPLLRAGFTGSRVLPSGLEVRPDCEVFTDHGRVHDAAAFLAGVAGRRIRLTRDPLFQVVLARHGQDHLVLTIWHHAIADAWSVGLCTRWLGELYADRGGPPEGAGRWADFVADEAAAAGAVDDAGGFWASQQRDAALAALLPPRDGAAAGAASRAGSGVAVGAADMVRVGVAGAGFPERCRAAGSTPGAVLLAAALLAGSAGGAGGVGSAGGADGAGGAGAGGGPVVLPTTLAGREPPYEHTVGLLMRTVLLRGEPARSPAEMRRAVLRQLTRCWRHRHESLLLLAERDPAVAARLGAGPLPFFAQLLDVPSRELVLPGCTTELVHNGFERTTRFGVELHLRPGADGAVEGAFSFDTARYDRAAVAAAATRYRDLVERVVAGRPAAVPA